jgi:cleavage and polyadenylation specificity factor subunit 3
MRSESLVQVRDIVGQGGRCLIPVVALGRAQELLLILEDCWKRYPDLHNIPIHQTSGIATQSLGVYQSYIEMMNEDIRTSFKQHNPFDFRHIRHTRGFRADSELGPCVVLATPSMLQTGLSRELFEAWCEDSRNGVIIADFAVQARPVLPSVAACCGYILLPLC